MQFPGPVRAVVGLLANAAEEAKHLPDRAIELPMLAVSTALQMSLRAQQRYARLAARGDEVLNRRSPGDEPPPWATFDEPVSMDELRRGSLSSAQARAASDLLDELLGVAATEGPTVPEEDAAAAAPAKKAPAQKASAQKAPAKKAPARKAPARTSAAKKAPAKKAPAPPAPATEASDGPPRGKSVSKPRHTAPSRFDAVDDE